MTTPTPTTPDKPPTSTTATPDAQGYVPPTACNANSGFHPTWEWNLLLAVAFFLTTLFHVAQMLASRKWFCWVVAMGAHWELVCFVLRTLGAFDQQRVGFVVGGSLFFLLAPLCEFWFLLVFFPSFCLVGLFVLLGVRGRRWERVLNCGFVLVW
jgi:hypothetical protein